MRRAALLLCTLLAGCERRAPGPLECKAFAELALAPSAPRATRDELVRQCLTTPFDYTMLTCVQRTRAYRPCRAGLEQRLRKER